MGKMKQPELEVIRFENEDVIAASGAIRLSGIRDNNPANAALTVGTKSFTRDSQAADAADALGLHGVDAFQIFFYDGNDSNLDNSHHLGHILYHIGNGDEENNIWFDADYNGTYTYIGKHSENDWYLFRRQ